MPSIVSDIGALTEPATARALQPGEGSAGLLRTTTARSSLQLRRYGSTQANRCRVNAAYFNIYIYLQILWPERVTSRPQLWSPRRAHKILPLGVEPLKASTTLM